MIKVKVIFSKIKNHDYFYQYWFVSDTKQVSIKNEGITIYDENGAFKAFYYADKVVGVELTKGFEE